MLMRGWGGTHPGIAVDKSCVSSLFPLCQEFWTLIQTYSGKLKPRFKPIDQDSYFHEWFVQVCQEAQPVPQQHCWLRDLFQPLSPRWEHGWPPPFEGGHGLRRHPDWRRKTDKKIMQQLEHLPRRSQGRTLETLRSGWVSTTKPATLLVSTLVTSPFSSTSTFPSGLQQVAFSFSSLTFHCLYKISDVNPNALDQFC